MDGPKESELGHESGLSKKRPKFRNSGRDPFTKSEEGPVIE